MPKPVTGVASPTTFPGSSTQSGAPGVRVFRVKHSRIGYADALTGVFADSPAW